MQQINNHLDEVIKINDSSAAIKIWRSTFFKEYKTLLQMMKWVQDNCDKIILHASHHSWQWIHYQTHWNNQNNDNDQQKTAIVYNNTYLCDNSAKESFSIIKIITRTQHINAFDQKTDHDLLW